METDAANGGDAAAFNAPQQLLLPVAFGANVRCLPPAPVVVFNAHLTGWASEEAHLSLHENPCEFAVP